MVYAVTCYCTKNDQPYRVYLFAGSDMAKLGEAIAEFLQPYYEFTIEEYDKTYGKDFDIKDSMLPIRLRGGAFPVLPFAEIYAKVKQRRELKERDFNDSFAFGVGSSTVWCSFSALAVGAKRMAEIVESTAFARGIDDQLPPGFLSLEDEERIYDIGKTLFDRFNNSMPD